MSGDSLPRRAPGSQGAELLRFWAGRSFADAAEAMANLGVAVAVTGPLGNLALD
jgi:hypothetical protein